MTTLKQPNGKELAWEILKWIIGVFLMIGGIGFLVKSFLAGLLIFVSGLLVTPIVSEWLIPKFPLWKKKPIRIVVPIVLFLIGGIVSNPNIPKEEKEQMTENKKQAKAEKDAIALRMNYVMNYIQNNDSTKIIRNLKELAKIAKTYSYSSAYQGYFYTNYVKEIQDTLTGAKTIIFDPQFNFKDDETFLKKIGNKGILKNYVLRFNFPVGNDTTATVRSILYFSRTSEGSSYSTDSIPDYNTFINKNEIDKKLAEIELQARQEQIAKQNEEWKDKHWLDARAILSAWADDNLADPKDFTESFAYPYENDNWIVWRKCKAKNAFGVYLQVRVRGLFDSEGNALSIGIE